MKDHVTIRVESPAFEPDAVRVAELSGTESIGRLFELQLRLVSLDAAALDEEKLLTSPMAVVFERTDGTTGIVTEERRLVGMVCTLRDRSLADGAGREVLVTFVPRAWQATLTRTSDIFMDLTVPDIIQKKLQSGAGLAPGRDIELRLKATYPMREFVVQYKESDWDFVCRLAEDLGIHFFWEVKDDRDVLVFADDNSAFKDATPAVTPFAGRGDRVDVYALEATRQVVPRRFQARDYNYRNPSMDLLGEAQITTIAGGGVVDEFGPHVKTGEEATFYARIRAEEAGARHLVFEGTADLPGLRAGSALTVTGHPRGELELAVIEVRHHATQAAFGHAREEDVPYQAAFRAIPRATPFRPARATPKPVVHGVVTGIVEAPAATNFGAIDEEGRYRVAFMYDSVSGRGEGKASRPLRMAQPSAAADRGFHVPLKAGTEVVITCVNGDPDRPIIAGAVPNPQTPSPVTAANAEKSVWKTNVNQIAIDDDKPRMKMTVNGEDHGIQIGTENFPEFGLVLGTIGNVASMSDGVSTAYSSMKASYQDYKTGLTGKNILETAGVPNPWNVWKKIDAVVGAASEFTKAASSTVDMANELWTSLSTDFKKRKSDADKAKAAAATKVEKAKAAAVEKLALGEAARPQVIAEPDGSRRLESAGEARERALADAFKDGRNADEKRKIVEAEKGLDDALQEVAAADGELKEYEQGSLDLTPALVAVAPLPMVVAGATEPGSVEIDDVRAVAKAAAEKTAKYAGYAKTGLKVGETVHDTVKAAKAALDKFKKAQGGLISKISKAFSKTAGKTMDATVTTTQRAAAAMAKTTSERCPAEIGSFAKPYNIQASMGSASLFGTKNTFLFAGKTLTAFSGGSATVVARKRVDVKSKNLVEVSAKEVVLSAKQIVDVHSADKVKIVAHTAEKTSEPPAGTSMWLHAKDDVLIKSTDKDIQLNAEKNIHLETLAEGIAIRANTDVLVYAEKKIQLTAKADLVGVAQDGKFQIEAAKGAGHLIAKTDVTLQAGDAVKIGGKKGTIKMTDDLVIKAKSVVKVTGKKIQLL